MTSKKKPESAQPEASEPTLSPTAVVFRNPVPGGPESATEEIERQDGGWLFTDPETQVRIWVPDSNVTCVKFA